MAGWAKGGNGNPGRGYPMIIFLFFFLLFFTFLSARHAGAANVTACSVCTPTADAIVRRLPINNLNKRVSFAGNVYTHVSSTTFHTMIFVPIGFLGRLLWSSAVLLLPYTLANTDTTATGPVRVLVMLFPVFSVCCLYTNRKYFWTLSRL